MENDTIFTEMQQQMQQLRAQLDQQKIINDRMLKNSYNTRLNTLRNDSWRVVLLCPLGMLSMVYLWCIGFSLPLFIVSEVLLLTAWIAKIIICRHVPHMEQDLVSAARELSRFKTANVNWIKFGLPIVAVWFVWLVTEIIISNEFPADSRVPLIACCTIGAGIGLMLGLRIRNRIIRSTEEVISQLEKIRHEADAAD